MAVKGKVFVLRFMKYLPYSSRIAIIMQAQTCRLNLNQLGDEVSKLSDYEDEMIQQVPLRLALQRANEVYRKDGRNKLFHHIGAREISCFGGKVVTYVSTECYEFNKSRPMLVHKDQYYEQREILANKLAFQNSDREHRHHAVYEGDASMFCFLDVEIETEMKNSKLAIHPTERCFGQHIDEDRKNIFLSSISFNSQKTIKESKYWRHITYKRHECYDVFFDAIAFERFFPHTQMYASKQRRGRTETYSQSKLDAALDKIFPDVGVELEITKIMEAAGKFYAAAGDGFPVEKTLRRKSERWLARRRKPGHK